MLNLLCSSGQVYLFLDTGRHQLGILYFVFWIAATGSSKQAGQPVPIWHSIWVADKVRQQQLMELKLG